jgi:hypothetical protein
VERGILTIGGFVKSLKSPLSVIPAQAGIQYFQVVRVLWIPVFTGMTTFYDSITIEHRNFFIPIRNNFWEEPLS